MLLSIIIAVYNDVEGLSNVLKSIELSGKDFSDFEVIIVDDGSPVSYDEVLSTISFKYKYIKQENGRQGKARNRGMKEADGEYLWFVDADDLIAPNAISDIVKTIHTHQQKEIYYFDAITNGDALNSSCVDCLRDEILLGQANNKYTVAPWNKVYKKDFLMTNNILFIEKKKYEDLYFVMLATMKSKEFYYESKIIYEYIYNPTSTTKVHNDTVLDIFDILDELIVQFKINNVDKSIINRTIFVHGIKYTVIRIFETKKLSFIKSIILNDKFQKYIDILDISYLSFKEKLFFKTLKFMYGLFK